MTYLKHIDGLRALAVLSVVIFHLDVFQPNTSWLPGGFLGVDVFFVISGFLITSIILREASEKRFTFAAFYLRRARRILPALFATIAVTLLVGAIMLSPERLAALGASAGAATLSFSNVYFWLTAGYFDAEAVTKPLLHTWSLGVEEQFYFLWPIVILIFQRSRIATAGVIVFLLVASLGASVLFLPSLGREAIFYLMPFRIFELAIGASCIALRLVKIPAWLASILTLLGLALVAFGLRTYTAATVPGPSSALTCLGAALLISTADRSVLAAIFTNPISVFVGKISYSLYLAHWPVVVFYYCFTLRVLTQTDKLVCVAIMALCALVLYYGVERPFHYRLFKQRPLALVAICVSSALAFVLVSGSIWQDRGWRWRFPEETQALFRSGDTPVPRRARNCYLNVGQALRTFDAARCLRMRPDRINVLLLGDSHAARMFPGLRAAFPNVNLMQANAAACRAIRGRAAGQSRSCQELTREMFDHVIPTLRPDYVVLSSNWQLRDVDEVKATILYLKGLGIRTILFGPVPGYDNSLPEIVFRGRNAPDLGIYAARHLNPQIRSAHLRLGAMAIENEVAFLDIYRFLCSRSQCTVLTQDGVPYYSDANHLSTEGSIELFAQLRDRGALSFEPHP